MRPASDLSRREFVTAAATCGLVLTFALPAARGAHAATAFEPNAWLTITPDGITTVHVTKAEMGQGVGTALAQIVAEELEADWRDVRIDYPAVEPKYGRMVTGGSRSIYESFDPLARAGAAARLLLVEAAARLWAVELADCIAERSTVRHRQTGRTISYGDLVAGGPITRTLSADQLNAIALKTRDRYTIVGRPLARFDIPEKVDGRARFPIDVFLPRMAYATVAYPPTRQGGRHTAVDDTAARRVKGHLKTVVTDDLVAIVADTYEAASEARDALRIAWDPGPHAQVSTAAIFGEYERRVAREAGERWVDVGDVMAAMARAAITHTATYTTDVVVHAQAEPAATVARYHDGVYEIFTGARSLTTMTQALAEALKVERSKIRLHQQYVGGSFGRNVDGDIELEAAVIAREAGRPVKLIRSREDDLTRGFYRTPALQVLRAALAGPVVGAWDHAIVAAHDARVRYRTVDSRGRIPLAIRGADHPYTIANRTVRAIRADIGIPTGFYRSVEPGYTVFAVESFLDEMAHLATVDPLSMRLSMLGSNPRLANVLRRAAARSGWGQPLPRHTGRGIAGATERQPQFRTAVAAVVQARVDPESGAVTVEKIVCAVDCGLVVNPDGAQAQIEGALLFGLSAALKEHGTLTGGAFDQKNFDEYRILRMDDVPDVDVHMVDGTERPTGLGEPPMTVVAPALANAIFAATGARVRRLPFLPDRVLQALRERA